MNNFKELNVWQKAIEQVKKIYQITDDFPNIEQFGLTSQIRKAAVSIPSNIAEVQKMIRGLQKRMWKKENLTS